MSIQENTLFSFDSFVNDFLYEFVEDENFDDAKDHLNELIRIARDNPDEKLNLAKDED